MNFNLTEERQILQDGLCRFLKQNYQQDQISETHLEFGYSPKIWQGLAEMGIIGAMFTEEEGGFAGQGFDIALIFEELGRAAALEPLLDTAILAGGLISSCGNEKQKALIDEIISGSKQFAFAHYEPNSRHDETSIKCQAVKESQSYKINGRKAVVFHASSADYFIVSARTSEGQENDNLKLFCIPTYSPGVTISKYALFGGEMAAEIEFCDVMVEEESIMESNDNISEHLDKAIARACLACSSEALGLMETIKNLTVSYLKTRKQFGQPIGKFQALQHRMVDMAIEIEQARSAVINLAGHVDSDSRIRNKHVSATKHLIGEVAKLVAEESIQMHGGIGMTEEYELGRFVKRLLMVDHRFGDSIYYLERFIKLAVV